MIIGFDIETRSRCDLKKCGAHVYANDPSTTALCFAWRIDRGPEQWWTPGDPQPSWITHVPEDALIVAHNALF